MLDILGSVGRAIPDDERLDHSVRLVGTWSGSDKLMMTLQYTAKLLIPLLQTHAERQFRAGKRVSLASPTAEGLFKLAAQLSVGRRVSALPGFLGILKAISALERTPHAHDAGSQLKLTLQRVQGLSMVLYYPLEWAAFFSSPFAPLIPTNLMSAQTGANAQLWSVRMWGIFVAIQAILLRIELGEINSKGSGLKKDGESETKVQRRRKIVVYGLLANVSRLPVILHWSTVGGIYKNEIWSSVFSFISAVAALRGGWESTRAPIGK